MDYWLAFYAALPAFLANMTPVLAQKWNLLPKLNVPIDCGKTLRKKRITGDHKTVRGFIVGIVSAIIIALLQYLLQKTNTLSFPYIQTLPSFLAYGFLAGFGALFGDAFESIFKRQIGIKSGRPFIPFDQIDYILGFLLFTSLLISWETKEIIFLILCGLILNPLTNIIGYLLRIKKTYW